MFDKILIANRGEIAVRILRSAQELGLKTVAVHSTQDANDMHVRLADEAICIGGPEPMKSYLNPQAILMAAHISNADAIHPGYGFLSENSSFAQMTTEHGFKFIGPTHELIKKMGDKIQAKKTAQIIGLPLVPGSNGAIENLQQALNEAEKIQYPVILKASAGGGGRGMKVVDKPEDMAQAFMTTQKEALNAFKNPNIYLEKYLQNPKHIEIQIIADEHGNVVQAFERDCSVQRKHQKILEEAPAPQIDKNAMEKLQKIVQNAMKKLQYVNAGTLEFLYENGQFYFIEMNTRIQVEHTITEAIISQDLVAEQILIAAGEKLSFQQGDICPKGHAIQCRINAENPHDFTPSPGTVTHYHPPAGHGIRIDSALFQGSQISPYYDSMVGKIIAWGNNRKQAIAKMSRALNECVISGIQTTLPLHQKLLQEEHFIEGNYSIHWLENWIKTQQNKI